jgi:hypothetical protein
MYRSLAIVKYVPAVMCALLVVAWSVSAFAPFCLMVDTPDFMGDGVSIALVSQGNMFLFHEHTSQFRPCFPDDTFVLYDYHTEFGVGIAQANVTDVRSRFAFVGPASEVRATNLYPIFSYSDDTYIACPIPMVATLLLPLAVGCLTRFRFPLWSYFVWTSLVAAELAYYLQ